MGSTLGSPLDLVAVRTRAGLTQAELAELLAVDRGVLAVWEAGECPPLHRLVDIGRICELDDRELGELLRTIDARLRGVSS